jgi:DNA-binding response OmpR family regulator
MLMDAQATDPLFESILSIDRCVKSGSKLTKQLLGYARGGKYDVKPTDIRQVVAKTGAMFGRTNKDITIELSSSDELSIVEVDQGQIEQVLLNLCLNAREAMPTGGRLSFALDNVWLDEFYFEAKPYKMPVGKYVRISVTDTGVGMDKETLNKIFEPFFTTRGIGKGAGLGLASAFGIVKNHGGLINCYSEKGLGTTFNIYLPASTRMLESESKPRGLYLQGGSETILLVDDEELVRNASEKMLSRLGYKVILAAGGNEAIKLYEKHQQGIDLVILDIIMPDKSGQEVYESLRSINPEVRVLFASGYSQFAKRLELSQANGFIQKPFDTHRLSSKIRQALAGATEQPVAPASPNASSGTDDSLEVQAAQFRGQTD